MRESGRSLRVRRGNFQVLGSRVLTRARSSSEGVPHQLFTQYRVRSQGRKEAACKLEGPKTRGICLYHRSQCRRANTPTITPPAGFGSKVRISKNRPPVVACLLILLGFDIPNDAGRRSRIPPTQLVPAIVQRRLTTHPSCTVQWLATTLQTAQS